MTTIEKLKREDIPELLDLYEQLLSFDKNVERSKAVYENMLENDNYFLFVVKDENQIVGSALGVCCLGLIEPFLVIEDVIVKDGIRGKGIGRKLFNAIDEFAAEKNCAYSLLVSSGFRKGAHQFYERIGFTDTVKGFRKIYPESSIFAQSRAE